MRTRLAAGSESEGVSHKAMAAVVWVMSLAMILPTRAFIRARSTSASALDKTPRAIILSWTISTDARSLLPGPSTSV